MDAGLSGLADDAQIVERAASSLPFRIGRRQIVHQALGRAGLIFQLLLQDLGAAAEIAGNGDARLHRGEELGLFLDHLREALFDQAVENLVNLLTRNVGARGQFQRLETGMTDQHQIGARLVGIQAQAAASGARIAENPSREGLWSS